jgi:hypothetical protein
MLRDALVRGALGDLTPSGAADLLGSSQFAFERLRVTASISLPLRVRSGITVTVHSIQVAIKRIVGVVEEGTRAAIAALGHMVRMIGDDNTGKAGHVA